MAGEHSELVIIGSGMSALRLVEALRKRGDTRSVTLLGEERALPYNRIMLSPLLAGESHWQQLVSHPTEWYRQQGITLRLGQPVVAVNCDRRHVRCADGFELSYRDLVFATGASAAKPTLPGIELPGVTAFRNVDDVTELQRVARGGGEAVVLGGGLLGLEAAVALAARGMAVTLVHRAAQLMNRQLDALASEYLRRAIEARGVRVCTGYAPIAIDGVDRVRAVRLENGAVLPADLVVAAIGIEPVVAPARAAGLEVNRGIIVDAAMRATRHSVYAVGECCELNGETVGLVAPIWQQVDVLAANLCGESRAFEARPYVTMLKVSGVDVHVMGDITPRDGTRVLVYQDRPLGIYKKLVLRGDAVVGALLFGDIADSQLFFELIQQGTGVGDDDCRLLLAGEIVSAQKRATA